MSISISLPSPLRPYADHASVVGVDGTTVCDALASLATLYPRLRPHLFAETGAIRRFLAIYVNDVNARDLEGDTTALGDGDSLFILPSIAGG